jgi:hypothetical protein
LGLGLSGRRNRHRGLRPSAAPTSCFAQLSGSSRHRGANDEPVEEGAVRVVLRPRAGVGREGPDDTPMEMPIGDRQGHRLARKTWSSSPTRLRLPA